MPAISTAQWKGGRVETTDGYIKAWAPDHPKAQNGRYVLEHRLVMERAMGRYLATHEQVHHRNGDRGDNRIENLELWINGQPNGSRVADAIVNAVECLRRYAPHLLNDRPPAPA